MKKLIVTVILAASTAVCSFGVAAESDKNKETTTKSTPPQDTSKRDEGKKGDQPSSTSEIMREKMPKDLPPGVKHEYRDQEVMDKKPYKQ
jgi:hypothetical protein